MESCGLIYFAPLSPCGRGVVGKSPADGRFLPLTLTVSRQGRGEQCYTRTFCTSS
jgi:hypothetical protein